MRLAVAAAVTGAFSLKDAVGTFLWVAIGGIAIDVGVTWLVVRMKEIASRKLGEEPGAQILISLPYPSAPIWLPNTCIAQGSWRRSLPVSQ